jgi:hypothetical protein
MDTGIDAKQHQRKMRNRSLVCGEVVINRRHALLALAVCAVAFCSALAAHTKTAVSAAGASENLGAPPRVIDPRVDAREADYLGEIEAHRWPITKMPLKVYIAVTGDRGFDNKLCALIGKAFVQWTTTQSSLEVERVYDYGKADIVVERIAFADMSEGSAGRTFYDYDMTSRELKRPIIRARVNLYCPGGRASDLDAEASDVFYNLCLHEAGHAFGLDGHSSDPEDAMFAKSTNMKLSRRDLASIIHLYPKQ